MDAAHRELVTAFWQNGFLSVLRKWLVDGVPLKPEDVAELILQIAQRSSDAESTRPEPCGRKAARLDLSASSFSLMSGPGGIAGRGPVGAHHAVAGYDYGYGVVPHRAADSPCARAERTRYLAIGGQLAARYLLQQPPDAAAKPRCRGESGSSEARAFPRQNSVPANPPLRQIPAARPREHPLPARPSGTSGRLSKAPSGPRHPRPGSARPPARQCAQHTPSPTPPCFLHYITNPQASVCFLHSDTH